MCLLDINEYIAGITNSVNISENKIPPTTTIPSGTRLLTRKAEAGPASLDAASSSVSASVVESSEEYRANDNRKIETQTEEKEVNQRKATYNLEMELIQKENADVL